MSSVSPNADEHEGQRYHCKGWIESGTKIEGRSRNSRKVIKAAHKRKPGPQGPGPLVANQVGSPLAGARKENGSQPLVRGELDQHLGVAWFVESFGDVRTASHAGRMRNRFVHPCRGKLMRPR